MFGMKKIVQKNNNIINVQYEFTNPDTLIFVTGVPLSGKSTIAPLVSSSIKGCVLQSMDIMRLLMQEVENSKSEKKRNKFVEYGSCDSYKLINDGLYSVKNLIKGFNRYSEAVCYFLPSIISKLEKQGVKNLLFEGVQLTPSIVMPYLKNNSKLIILTLNESRMIQNRNILFSDDQECIERYSIERLLALQKEIINQSKKISKNSLFVIENRGDYIDIASEIMQLLLNSNTIKIIENH